MVVKRLKEVAAGKREFEQQMEVVGRISPHVNVAPLRAYYFSKDEKLLVFDYYQGGNFSMLLHGNDDVSHVVFAVKKWLLTSLAISVFQNCEK